MRQTTKLAWLLLVASLGATPAAWGGLLVDNDFYPDDPAAQFQLNAVLPGDPIAWLPGDCRTRLIEHGIVGQAVSMIAPDGTPIRPATAGCRRYPAALIELPCASTCDMHPGPCL